MAEPPEPARRLFIMLRHTVDAARLREHLPAHLAFLKDGEESGRVVLSGPAEPAGEGSVSGLTVIDAATLADATAFAERDPMVRAGAIRFTVQPWSVNEGALRVTVRLSDRTGRLG